MRSRIEAREILEQVSAELRERAEAYAARYGKLYAPIRHPGLSDIAATHGPERYDLIEPHLPHDARTALDIGAHWGFFANHLAERGLEVTAVESDLDSVWFLKEIAKASGNQIKVIEESVLKADLGHYDVVLALNIFHHFLKKKAVFEQFRAFLKRLDCDCLIFQSHAPAERQMREAYRDMNPEQFCEFIVAESRLSTWTEIGDVAGRKIFKLT